MSINLKPSNANNQVELSVKIIKKINVYGLASGVCAGEYGSQLGVWDLYYSIGNKHPLLQFKKMYHHNNLTSKLESAKVVLPMFTEAIIDIAYGYKTNTDIANTRYLFLTGDHANAIGVWGGIINGINDDLGLIWIDSHLDSHNPGSSPSKNIHGMPVAHLMGYGFKEFVNLINVKIKPQNICFIGTCDYEQEEIDFLKAHNVKIIFVKDINKTNINTVFNEAIEHVSKNTKKFGVSLDVDVFDKKYTPGTGCETNNNFTPNMLYPVLNKLCNHAKFVGLEITEYNPLKDKDRKTFNVVKNIIKHTFEIKDL